jgi:type II secretory pathway pseudopilin PulG
MKGFGKGHAVNRHGFTLIELSALCGVLVFLITLILPGFAKGRASTAATVCLNNQRQLALAFAAYSQDNNDRIVGTTTPMCLYLSSAVAFGLPRRVFCREWRWKMQQQQSEAE